MTNQIELGDITIDVELKDIKNIHLSVYPPKGCVKISAPSRMDMDTIRVYAISRLDWIKQQQKKFMIQERETPREYLERESHYVWGARYLMQMVEQDAPPSIELKHHHIVLRVRPGTDESRRQAVMDSWYRRQVYEEVAPLLARWEGIMGVKAGKVHVQRMKTRWGSCNPKTGRILLNTELAKKPRACLEYVVVHELAHLIEPTHNARFVRLMDQYLPSWQMVRDELNRAPLGHVEWKY